MTDLEKELVEKLCECDAKNGYVCVLHREALPLIRSHTQTLVAAAYARATNLIAQVRDDYHSNDGPFDMGMRLQMLENEVCSLTPADAARELERREDALIREALQIGQWAPQRMALNYDVLIKKVRDRLPSLSKPAPVERSNEND